VEQEILLFAEEAARGAGRILLSGFRSADTVVSYKSSTDLVTNMDRASEEFLFNSIREKYPDHTIIAEEGSRSSAAGDFTWYIDPLDGTNNYAHGIAQFSVSIGIYSQSAGAVTAGIVYDPFHDEMFSANRGDGAFMNGVKISVSRNNDIGVSILATGFPYDKASNPNNNLKEFARIVPKIQGIRRMGSAALDLAGVACGRFDGYWEAGVKPWDTAAGSLLVGEGGGKVTKYRGGKYDPVVPEILATNGLIHESMIELLSGNSFV